MSPEDLKAMEWFQSAHSILVWVSLIGAALMVIIALLREKYERHWLLVLFLTTGAVTILAVLGVDRSHDQVRMIEQRAAREREERLEIKLDQMIEVLAASGHETMPDAEKVDQVMAGLDRLVKDRGQPKSGSPESEQSTEGRSLTDEDKEKIREILRKSGRKKIYMTSLFKTWEERQFYYALKEAIETDWIVEKLPSSVIGSPEVTGLRIDAAEKPSREAFDTANILYLALKSVSSFHIQDKLVYNPQLEEDKVVLVVGSKPGNATP